MKNNPQDSKDILPAFFTLEKTGSAEFKDRGSRFIALGFPLASTEQFKEIIGATRKEHAKATHHCFAYRIGLTGDSFRVSDDGEPSGTAGKPILGQLDSRSIVNAGIIVVRYFGGSLLGIPGLINAYKTAASFVLQTLPLLPVYAEKTIVLHFDYTQVNAVMLLVKYFHARIIEQELQLYCRITLSIHQSKEEEFLYRAKDIPGLELSC